ncbi:hypothetical protein [Kitasatospora sp. NPDC093806]|uniref:hypothetical protein n=1 Tax=Kitasatospora sp. NPDC093806 TaxID=3155075 RepID=UPI003416A278
MSSIPEPVMGWRQRLRRLLPLAPEEPAAGAAGVAEELVEIQEAVEVAEAEAEAEPRQQAVERTAAGDARGFVIAQEHRLPSIGVPVYSSDPGFRPRWTPQPTAS